MRAASRRRKKCTVRWRRLTSESSLSRGAAESNSVQPSSSVLTLPLFSATSARTSARTEAVVSATRKEYTKSRASASVLGATTVCDFTPCIETTDSVIDTLRSSDTGNATPFSSAVTRSTSPHVSLPTTTASLSTSPVTCREKVSGSRLSGYRVTNSQCGSTSWQISTFTIFADSDGAANGIRISFSAFSAYSRDSTTARRPSSTRQPASSTTVSA